MSLTAQISDINKRLNALESADLDENVSISRISKIYHGVKITAVIKTKLHTYNLCGISNICGPNNKI